MSKGEVRTQYKLRRYFDSNGTSGDDSIKTISGGATNWCFGASTAAKHNSDFYFRDLEWWHHLRYLRGRKHTCERDQKVKIQAPGDTAVLHAYLLSGLVRA